MITLVSVEQNIFTCVWWGLCQIYSCRRFLLEWWLDRYICDHILLIILFNATQKGRGREMDFSAWVYLSLPSPAHLISSQPHAQTLPPTYPALSLCSLHFPNTHTHTQAQDHYLALPILTSTRTLYIFLHSPHQQHKITFHFSLSSWTPTLSKSLHSVQ